VLATEHPGPRTISASPISLFRIVEPHPVDIEAGAGHGVEEVLTQVVLLFRLPRAEPSRIVLVRCAEERIGESLVVA